MVKEWFVYLYQVELEMDATPAEKLVYTAIKSFTENGLRHCESSFRQISARSGVNDRWVKVAVQNLIKNGWIRKIGEGTKRGGTYWILEVQTLAELNKLSAYSGRTLPSKFVESPDSRSSSSYKSASKKQQGIKVYKYSNIEDITPEVIQEIAKEHRISEKEVAGKLIDLKNHCDAVGKKYENYLAALRNFIKRDMDSGKIKTESEKLQAENSDIPDIESRIT